MWLECWVGLSRISRMVIPCHPFRFPSIFKDSLYLKQHHIIHLIHCLTFASIHLMFELRKHEMNASCHIRSAILIFVAFPQKITLSTQIVLRRSKISKNFRVISNMELKVLLKSTPCLFPCLLNCTSPNRRKVNPSFHLFHFIQPLIVTSLC